MAIKTVFWDFDGVIMDSMPVRTEGFRMLLSDYPNNEVDDLVKYHLINGGLSRYVKIRYFFEKIRNEAITEEEVQQWADRYSVMMLRELQNPKRLISETVEFIKRNYNQFNFHIVSGSDGNELRKICEAVGLKKYFLSINGSPTPKKQLVEEILKLEKYPLNECILIGDSGNDFDAAEFNSISFAGYNNTSLSTVGDFYIQSFDSLEL